MIIPLLVSIITFSTMSLHGMENGTVSVEDAKIFASYRSGNSLPLGKALHGAILSNDFPLGIAIRSNNPYGYAGSFALTRALRSREYDGRFTKRIAY